MAAQSRVLRLLVRLLEVQPAIWRRIEIRADATFWALHVALQGAMGWTDSHLHEFELPNADSREPVRIGMPDLEDDGELEVLVDYDERLDAWIQCPGERFFYVYDYGDGWRHEVMVEAIEPTASGVRYPRCLAGARACPPENVGGPGGYATFLQALIDPHHEEHERYRRFVGRKYDPERFDPAKVRFENPNKRLRQVGRS